MGMMSRALSMVGLGRKATVSLIRTDDWLVDRGTAGESVTPSTSLGLSSVWACCNLIAGSISSLPCMVYQKEGMQSRVVADHSLYRVLHDQPNYDQTALDFWDFICLSIELWGNAYARVVRRDGQVISLHPVQPDLVTVRRLKEGPIEYSWTQDGVSYRVKDRDVLHIRGPGGNPLGGMSTLTFGRNTFSSALAADRAAAGMFGNGMRPSAIIKFKEWLTPEQRAIAHDQLTQKYMGSMNAGRPFVAEGGVEYQSLSITPEDAQMIETRQLSVEEVCRFFGVPPVMIGHAGASTAWPTSVEQQGLIFQKFTLRRRVKRIEQAIAQQLITAEDRSAGIYAEFNLEGLLRGASSERASFYQSMSNMGAMTINEIRALENLPPVAGGDVPRMQSQNIPITQAGQEANDGNQGV